MDSRPRSVLARNQCSRHFCRRRCAPWFHKARGFRSRRGFGGGTVHPSVFEQSVMIEKSELLRVPTFADLPDDQLEWFLSQSQEQLLKPGDTYIRQGDAAENMSVVLEGDYQARGEINGETFVFPVNAGDVTGVLPFSRMKKTPITGRAVTNGRLLRFPSAQFPQLVQKMPELATRLVGLMSDRIREATRFEQQRDRLAALGKLSAGLAHELNNPASAARRATSQLRNILKQLKEASHELGARELTSAQKAEVDRFEAALL